MVKVVLDKNEMLTKEEVRDLILTNDNAVMRAAIVLYQQQDLDERNAGYSLHLNNRGFNKFDSAELSNFASKVLINKGAYQKDIMNARYKLVKYSQQIADIANEKRNIQLTWEFK